MKNIDANSLNIRELLEGKKYFLGYFQRGYNWERKNIEDLIDDLVNEFNSQRNDNDAAGVIDSIPFYFLGSIIVSEDNGELNLIDGQQRLTSLSLILIYIARTYKELSNKIAPLIYNEEGKNRTYTIHDLDRVQVMDALWNGEEFATTEKTSLSARNMEERFNDVESCFRPHKLTDIGMEKFFDWLTEQVCITEIKASSANDGYKIFEAANDRGLNLTPVEMLKSYLLAGVNDSKEQNRLDELWKKRIDEIANAKETDHEAIKAWFRAAYTDTNSDFDSIGGEFHRWVRDKARNGGIELRESKDFIKFIEKDFLFYTEWYLELRRVSKKYSEECKALFYNQHNSFTLQYPLIMSTFRQDDRKDIIWKKINLVANFIDIFIARHLWNNAASKIAQRWAKSSINKIAIDIRFKDIHYIVDYLKEKTEEYEDFTHYNIPSNSKNCHQFLARFSAYLDEEMGLSDSNFKYYIDPKKYNLEHIMPNHFERDYKDITNDETDEPEFESEEEFKQQRNRLGANLLLEASNNRGINDRPYVEKVSYYSKQNMFLAKVLAEESYELNPKFRSIAESHKFKPFSEFLKKQIEYQEKRYARLAKEIWNPVKLDDIVEADIEEEYFDDEE